MFEDSKGYWQTADLTKQYAQNSDEPYMHAAKKYKVYNVYDEKKPWKAELYDSPFPWKYLFIAISLVFYTSLNGLAVLLVLS